MTVLPPPSPPAPSPQEPSLSTRKEIGTLEAASPLETALLERTRPATRPIATTAPLAQRRRTTAVDAVLSNQDLVAHILRSGIGPSTFVAAGGVCKAWRAVCRSDEAVLRCVAMYQGGLTRTAFRGLFGLTSAEAAAYPHIVRRRFGGGSYCVYGDEAVDRVLGADGGMDAVRMRMQNQKRAAPQQRTPRFPAHPQRRLQTFQLEELLHRRAADRAHAVQLPLAPWIYGRRAAATT